ncbi:actin binding protein family [Striga hermonthica]|uniref:Actin binding protein family n=1 Tax=Striga hermonthica TaxID=68872 RepID=A0A9N7R4J2_STRHE|nr:actin binding protein family [Striga hermonthica]
MSVREKRESSRGPVLIKFGVALAFSLGGVVYTFLKTKSSKSKPQGKDSEADSRRERLEIYEDAFALQNSINGDRDGFVLSEVDHFINKHNIVEHEEHNLEIENLRNKVQILEERERMLEIQMLEYYGLKEQETAILELQNRLKIHNMEAKLYNLKIESLQSENRKLEEQVADREKVANELEAAKAKIKLLRKKLRSEAEHNREQILSLQERVMKLQEEEKNERVDGDLEMQLKEMKNLKEELEEVKRTNEVLKVENLELTHKLEYMKMLVPPGLDEKEIQALKEENHLLRLKNEDLTKEIEQIHANRCSDIEELVYLRWINACLRYEMRNYQPAPGETIARDLSKTLSPKSEKKAKQLILEYANREGSGDQGINISDFDSGRWSNSQASCELDDDLLLDNSSPRRAGPVPTSKSRVFAKLMRLIRGKDGHDPVETQDLDISRNSGNSHSGLLDLDFGPDSDVKTIRTLSGTSSANSVDLQRSCSCGAKSTAGESSDDGSLSIFRRFESVGGCDGNLSSGVLPHQDAQNGAKNELVKYAEALKKSHAELPRRRRSASYSSF